MIYIRFDHYHRLLSRSCSRSLSGPFSSSYRKTTYKNRFYFTSLLRPKSYVIKICLSILWCGRNKEATSEFSHPKNLLIFTYVSYSSVFVSYSSVFLFLILNNSVLVVFFSGLIKSSTSVYRSLFNQQVYPHSFVDL